MKNNFIMKIKIKLLAIIIFSCIYNLKINACTSFAVYSSEIWYGMNFDYPNVDINFSITKISNRKIFVAQFGSGNSTTGYIADINDSGLFINYQLLYYNNWEPTFGCAYKY